MRVLGIAEDRFAVEIRAGSQVRSIMVTVPDSLLDDLVIAGVDREAVVVEAVKYLIEGGGELPAEVDLVAVEHEDPAFVEELRLRMGARPVPPEI
ncbi:hypothetical protein LWC34_01530 [Kibdelosporangium philippinense]|uniref:Uncharacterized protein n=1 Tax=Kibdelosporangium philippinense TaxID=211113 RepID=A0ABS8Z0N8_9PSEU|nr:hypothetical protein [Kibdelosporangium philippinense]MCE7001529.1 hypothetical protein [Kibdelosporangium philippinense]